jgi:hypothetical protein
MRFDTTMPERVATSVRGRSEEEIMQHTLIRAMFAVALTMSLAARPVAATPFVAPDCWGAEDRSRSFNGSMTTNGGTIVEQIGRRGSERVVQKSYGGLRVCMVTRGFDGERDDKPSRWPFRSDHVILETRTPNDVRTLDVNDRRLTYTVNGAVRPLDAAAREWRDDLLELLDVIWDLGQLRGRVSSLSGEISSINGERSSLEGQISSYRGHVSSMQGEISSLRGQVSSMRGEISSIRGHESSLRGQISSEGAAISNLRGMSWERARGIDVDAGIQRHEENIQRLERQIRDYDAESRVREIERRIDAFGVETRSPRWSVASARSTLRRRLRAFSDGSTNARGTVASAPSRLRSARSTFPDAPGSWRSVLTKRWRS